jgi:hypothetical protein
MRPSSGTLSLLLSSMLDELSVLQMHHELEPKRAQKYLARIVHGLTLSTTCMT